MATGFDSSESCPRCKTTQYLSPTMVFLVSSCGHRLCDGCVTRQFKAGALIKCFECDTMLRRRDYSESDFEDLEMEKELRIRKDILTDFNKKERDFPSLDEYNEYLEMVEDIIYDLANNLNVEERHREIAEYKKNNNQTIILNSDARKREDRAYEERLKREEEAQQQLLREWEEHDKQEREELLAIRQIVLDELAAGVISSAEVEQQLQMRMERAQQKAVKADILSGEMAEASAAGTVANELEPSKRLYDWGGGGGGAAMPQPKNADKVNKGAGAGELEQIQRETSTTLTAEQEAGAVAGGFNEKVAKGRAKHEALAGLFYVPGEGGEGAGAA